MWAIHLTFDDNYSCFLMFDGQLTDRFNRETCTFSDLADATSLLDSQAIALRGEKLARADIKLVNQFGILYQ